MTQPVKITSTLKSNILEIRWMPHNVCNFKCHYCFPGSNEGTDRAPEDIQTLIKNFDHLLNYYKKNRGKNKFHIKLLGGEPTLFTNLEYFIKEIKSRHDVYITIVSNGSRTLRWWQDYGYLLDNVVLSYHAAQADVNHHIDVADTLYVLGKKVTVTAVMDPSVWDKAVSAVNYMKEKSRHSWIIQTKKLVDYGQPEPIVYTTEQQKYMRNEFKRFPSIFWILKNYKLIFDGSIRLFESKYILDNGATGSATAQTYLTRNWNNFNGWSCDVGLDVMFIDSKGDITVSCGQRIYNRDTNYNILDRNFSKDYNPELVPIICRVEHCNCQPDTHVSKFKFSQGNVSRAGTIIPITLDRSIRNNKST